MLHYSVPKYSDLGGKRHPNKYHFALSSLISKSNFPLPALLRISICIGHFTYYILLHYIEMFAIDLFSTLFGPYLTGEFSTLIPLFGEEFSL